MLNELLSTVTTCSFDPTSGALSIVAETTTLPAGVAVGVNGAYSDLCGCDSCDSFLCVRGSIVRGAYRDRCNCTCLSGFCVYCTFIG